jgi:hypothetical protein
MTRADPELNAVEDIDRLCIRLFDSWCERRSLIPLAYLMHAWPILKAAPLAMTRLLHTLQELQQFHPDWLNEDDHEVIEQIFVNDDLSGNAGPDGSL